MPDAERKQTQPEITPHLRRPTAYILRSRFQPCLRLHYYAIKTLILKKWDEFCEKPEEAAGKAVVILMVIRDYEYVARDKPVVLPSIRYWPQFNPLAASETVRQLELALWSYFDEDDDFDERKPRKKFSDIFRHSVFPIQIPGSIRYILDTIDVESSYDDVGVPDQDRFLYDNFQMFRVQAGPGRRYRPCWYFPIFDEEDAKDAGDIADRMDSLIAANAEGGHEQTQPGSEPWIIIGDLSKVFDPRYGAEYNKRKLGAYGVQILDTIKQHFDFGGDFPRLIDEVPQTKLDRLNSITVSKSVSSYFRMARGEEKVKVHKHNHDPKKPSHDNLKKHEMVEKAVTDALRNSDDIYLPKLGIDDIAEEIGLVFRQSGGRANVETIEIESSVLSNISLYVDKCEELSDAILKLSPGGSPGAYSEEALGALESLTKLSKCTGLGAFPDLFEHCKSPENVAADMRLMERVTTIAREGVAENREWPLYRLFTTLGSVDCKALAELTKHWKDPTAA